MKQYRSLAFILVSLFFSFFVSCLGSNDPIIPTCFQFCEYNFSLELEPPIQLDSSQNSLDKILLLAEVDGEKYSFDCQENGTPNKASYCIFESKHIFEGEPSELVEVKPDKILGILFLINNFQSHSKIKLTLKNGEKILAQGSFEPEIRRRQSCPSKVFPICETARTKLQINSDSGDEDI